MAVRSAQQAVQNWQAGIAAGGSKYTQGIQSCTDNPMELAAQRLDVALANYTQAISSGRMANALRQTPVSFWKSQAQAASAKWSAGAQKGLPKMQAAAQRMQSVWQAAQDAARSAGPDGLARFTAAYNVMKASGKKAQQS